MTWKTFDPKKFESRDVYQLLVGSVVPRPIAFASTIDADNRVNLSPYSFFNVFSADPPLVIFSPTRRTRDNTTKDTFENLKQVKEVAISIVNYQMVNQMVLSSGEYPPDINEFEKIGFEEDPSELIRPPRVKEAPVSLECKVTEIIELGNHKGAGNLMLCEVLLIHVKEHLLDEQGKIDPFKLDAVGRMGGSWYAHANNQALFQSIKPNPSCLGFDRLPEYIRHSGVLTGNHLTLLANQPQLPDKKDIELYSQSDDFIKVCNQIGELPGNERASFHQVAREYLDENRINEAFKLLLAAESWQNSR